MATANEMRKPPVPMGGIRADAGFGLYVHWPFCKAKCPYCDFNSHVRSRIDQERWRRALIQDLAGQANRFTISGPLTSIFFGGGTPSLMSPATVAAIVDVAQDCFGFAPDIEITLEANPTSAEAANFQGYAMAGVNRLSMGVQSLDDDALRFLGREHTAGEAIGAVELAKKHIDRISFDLIYARAGQSPQDWQRELASALDHAVGHIALYQLTIEPGTRFHAEFRAGRLPILADDAQAELFDQTVETLHQYGYRWYEISNFAKAGDESRHNLLYWRYAPYLGIGPGAHGRLPAADGRVATVGERAPEAWLKRVARSGTGLRSVEPVSGRDAALEALMMGLRLEEGVPLARLEAILGEGYRDMLDLRGLATAIDNGWLQPMETRLIATLEGRRVLDRLLVEIVA